MGGWRLSDCKVTKSFTDKTRHLIQDLYCQGAHEHSFPNFSECLYKHMWTLLSTQHRPVSLVYIEKRGGKFDSYKWFTANFFFRGKMSYN